MPLNRTRVYVIGLILTLVACSSPGAPTSEPSPATDTLRAVPSASSMATSTAVATATPAPSPTETERVAPSTRTHTSIPDAEPTATLKPTHTKVVAQETPATDPSPASTSTPTETASPPTATSPQASPTPNSPSATPTSPPAAGPAPPRVYESSVTILTYGYETAFQETTPEDPVYPYPRMDLTQVGPPAPRTYRALVLENDYVALTILPELGGRIYRWVDKTTGRQLLYENPVIKPTEWGYRGWWLAVGGIEWAFPVDEHGLNEWRPWQVSSGNTNAGLAVTVWNVEERTGMQVGATIVLDAAHSYVTLQPWARNDTEVAQPYQLWLNAMLTLGGNNVSGRTQFVLPTEQVVVHSTGDLSLPASGGLMDWPVHGGRDLSWYSNWRAHLGFFVPGITAGFVGLYDQEADQGLVRAFTPGWPAGTKLFGPAGISPLVWTDDGSDYVELWSGATSSFWTYATLEPGQSVGWTERWYPVSGLGGLGAANAAAALRLTESGDAVEVGAAVSASTSGELTLWVGEQPVESWTVSLYPGQAFRATWRREVGGDGELGLRLENGDGTTVIQAGQVP
jgi:hypothetical protein